ncbi:MAG: hypothetical protein O6944_00120, partial [Gammaproteobacteria bacterium]|nr:hypothetical protein [Gammaproteobacteria bacterium]
LNRWALGSSHLPNDGLYAPDCAVAGSQAHRVPHPKPPIRVDWSRFRSKHKCATVFGGWEESSGKSQIKTVGAQVIDEPGVYLGFRAYLGTVIKEVLGPPIRIESEAHKCEIRTLSLRI